MPPRGSTQQSRGLTVPPRVQTIPPGGSTKPLQYSTHVKLEAFDIQGRLVEVIEDGFMHKGSYSVTWDSKRFAAGVYFLRLSANGAEVSGKIT